MKKRRKASPASKAAARCLTNGLVNMCAVEDESDCTGIVASTGPAEKPSWQRLDTQGKISRNGQRNRSCQSPWTGCAGSPACVEYCPVEDCMFWVPDEDNPPFGRIQIDPLQCIGCKKCLSKGPDGCFLDGCPWDAIVMVDIAEVEKEVGPRAYWVAAISSHLVLGVMIKCLAK